MFSICVPANHNKRAESFQAIVDWMGNSISKMKSAGIADSQIILDPGIGFATNPDLSFEVLRRVDELKNLITQS